jgi:glycosyltransferase involved in cell wall biosynthesis
MPRRHYERLIRRIRAAVDDVLPVDATVLVISRGDDALLDLAGREAWHFPQADNGAYAGHHPRDSTAAIRHLESLRKRGAGFLLLPATALWWLDYYAGLREHLQKHYTVAAEAPDEYVVYDVRQTGAHNGNTAVIGDATTRNSGHKRRTRRTRARGRPPQNGDVVEARHVLLGEFDPAFYRERYRDLTGTDAELLDHYLEHGWKEARDPCPWFSTSFYLERYSDIREAGINPFVHYLKHGRREARLPMDYHTIRANRACELSVSAIVPNYNHARFLEQRLRSIAKQSYTPSEIIILDDASTDDSRLVIERLVADLEIPVRLAFNDEQSGSVFRQWQNGLSLASGDLIWICESDDFADEAFLSHIVPYFNDPSITLAFGCVQFADETGAIDTWLDEYREQAESNAWSSPRVESAYRWFRGSFGLANVIPNVGGCVFRNQELASRVWDEAQRYAVCGDWYLYMHIATCGRIAYDPRAISYFRQHGANTSVRSYTSLEYYADHYRVARELRRIYGITDDALWRFYQRVREHYFRHFPKRAGSALHRAFPLQELLEEPKLTRHISVGILGFATGGAELFAINLANELARRGHQVSLLVLDGEHPNADIRRLLRAGIPVYERLLLEDIGPETFFQEYGVDVIHTHYQGVDLWIHEACRQTNVPYIVTLHGSHEVAGLSSQVREQLVSAVDHWVYTADKNLAVFADLPAAPQAVTKLPNAVPDHDDTFPIKRRVLAPKKNGVLFGIASRALKAKGWEIAVLALNRVQKVSDRPVYLALCGEGDDYDYLLRRYGRRKNVTFLGYQTAITDFYRLCDCCLLPTRFPGESFPFTLLESLKAGTPIIATDVGEIRGVVHSGRRRAGIVVPWLTDDDAFLAVISDAMLEMLDDAKREKWARAAATLGKRYSFDELASEYEAIYDTVDSIANRS